jgi:hypothetical protein
MQATSRKYIKPQQQKFSCLKYTIRGSFELDKEENYELSSLMPLLHDLWCTGPGTTVADLGGCAV